MKIFRFLLALLLVGLFFSFVNYQQGDIPPLGKFMSPFKGFWKNGEKLRINLSEELDAPQLQDQVTIRFDEQTIPHIFAKNDYDLYFAQGYITAYHRLWQMEFQVMATEGRLSEIVGEKALEFDRMKRRKGLKYAAKRSLEAIERDPALNNVLQAYTDGVNFWVNSLSYEDYPIEYKLLDYEPEPWSKLKCSLLLKYMADMLSSGEADLENTNAIMWLGREKFDLLFPESFKDIDPVIPSGTKWGFSAPNMDQPVDYYTDLEVSEVIDKPDPGNGSNNFVVSKAKTANGKVILANEPDLALNLPSIWYITQLNAPGVNTMGASIPGLPTVIIGFNDSIAWGVTNAKRDVVDWYEMEFRNSKREEYRYDRKWMKTEKIIEKIRVKGSKTFYDTIIYTHHGPIVYDDNFKGNDQKKNLAMKWTAHEETMEFKTFYLLNRSQNFQDFNQALEYFYAPAQNFAFGSASGDIGMKVSGQFPIKWKEQGKFLMDGKNRAHDWSEYIPHEHQPFIINPEKGFLSSANQHPVDSTYPYYAYDYNYEFYRNRRLNDRLSLMNDIEIGDMMKLQHDNYNYRASESLPFMLANLDSADLAPSELQYFKQLSKWDYFNEPELEAPSYYEAWWNQYYKLVWDEFDASDKALIKPHVYNTIYLMKNDSIHRFTDIDSTQKVETSSDLINISFRAAMESIEKWKQEHDSERVDWYLYKNTKIQHIIKDLTPFSYTEIKIGGNRNIVNAASSRHGPSWRMVVELGDDQVRAWGSYPGSQSGNPGNPAYGEMIENWASGIYYPLHFLNSVSEENDEMIFTFKLKTE